MRNVGRISVVLFALGLLHAVPARAQRLDDIIEILTFAWSQGDTRALAAMASREGISIETSEGRMGPLGAYACCDRGPRTRRRLALGQPG